MPSACSSSRRGPRAIGCAPGRRSRGRCDPRAGEKPGERRRSRPSDPRDGWILGGSRSATRLEPRRRAHPEPVPRRPVPRGGAGRDGRDLPLAGAAVPVRRPAPALRGRRRHDRGVRDHADRAAGGRAHQANEPPPDQRRDRRGRRLRRHRGLPAAGAAGEAAPGTGPRRDGRDRTRPGGPLRRDPRAAGRAPGDGPPRRPLLRAGRGMIGLSAYLVLAALVFSIGLFGVLTRRNAVGILLGIELMLNAVNINLVAFARFNGDLTGLIFTLFTISITVAEVAVGLAIVIAIFRVRRTVEADRLDLLRG